MGEAGDGNYYYIESPVQLADIFQTELQGLMANAGQKVSLGDRAPGRRASVAEVLNDLERNARGRLMLPNLVVGMPIAVVVRLKVPRGPGGGRGRPVPARLGRPQGGRRGGRLYGGLTLGSCPLDGLGGDPGRPRGRRAGGVLMAARAKKEAIVAYDHNDISTTRACLIEARDHILAAPASPTTTQELEALDLIRADLDKGQGAKFRKRTMWQSFRRKRGHDA